MDSRVEALSRVGPSLADLLMDVFCFAASPSFKGAVGLVGGARRVFKGAREVSADVPGGGGDLGGHLTRKLAERVASAYRDCRERGVDSSYLAIAETEVQILVAEVADEDLVVLSAVREPEGFEAFLRKRAAGRRGRIEQEAEPYLDALIRAVAAVYVEMAPWSRDFIVVALKSLLAQSGGIVAALEKQDAEHQEMHLMLLRVLEVQSDISRALEQLSGGARPGRVVYGARPDVAAGFRERAEQGRLRGLVVGGTQERAVLVGMAGCGKSQLASSLARECDAAGWGLVAWINASSKDSVISDLVELARQLGVGTSDNPTQDRVIERCLDHLQSAEASDRLVVFDNVEDFDDLTGVVPRGEGLRVVATSRSGRGWRAQRWKTVAVGVFPREESVAYLLDAAGSLDAEAADAVARRLGDLPLAVAQAAATASDEEWTLKRYLERLEKYSSRQVIRPVPGDSYTRDVSSALRMAVDSALNRIDEGLREAARLQVRALAVLAESGVPTRWIDPLADEEQANGEQANENTGADAAVEDADALNSAEDAHLALTALTKASVVQQSADKRVTMLHRLQGQVLRENWIPGEWAGAFDAAADILDRVNVRSLPREDAEGRRRQTRDLIEQLRAIAAQDYSHPLFERIQVRARLHHAFIQSNDLNLPSEALTLQGAVDVVEDVLGPEHTDTLTFRGGLADAYYSSGHLDKAIALHREVLAQQYQVLGEGKIHTLTSQSNLALAYVVAGRLREAIPLHEEILANKVRVLGPRHPSTLESQNNLAYAYQVAGRLRAAITLHEDTLTKRRKILGPTHPSTLESQNNLAGAYQAAGRLRAAITLYERVLADRVRVLGDDHPHTLTSRNNLAGAYQSAGRLSEAIALFEEVLADRVRVLGDDHPHTLAFRSGLASAYQAAGRLSEAIPLYEDALAHQRDTLGPTHPSTLTTQSSLANAYLAVDKLTEAIPLHEDTLAHQRDTLGPTHPSTLTTQTLLANAYLAVDKLTEAIPLYEDALAHQRDTLGPTHLSTLTTQCGLAIAYGRADKIDEAFVLLADALSSCDKVLGPKHFLTVMLHDVLGTGDTEFASSPESSEE